MIPLLIGGGARLISKVTLVSPGDVSTTVPTGATFCLAKLWGAGGGAQATTNGTDRGYAQGGPGAFVRGGLPVAPGQGILTHIGDIVTTPNSRGGDFSALWLNGDMATSPRLVAAGGGAAGNASTGDATFGGEGGADTGGVGTSLLAPTADRTATGGTQTGGGTGFGSTNTFLDHGADLGDNSPSGASGGGGYWGGGRGYGAGGGSSYADPSVLYPGKFAGEPAGAVTADHVRLPGGSTDPDYDLANHLAGRGSNHYWHGIEDSFDRSGPGRIVLAFYDFDPVATGTIALA